MHVSVQYRESFGEGCGSLILQPVPASNEHLQSHGDANRTRLLVALCQGCGKDLPTHRLQMQGTQGEKKETVSVDWQTVPMRCLTGITLGPLHTYMPAHLSPSNSHATVIQPQFPQGVTGGAFE